MRKYFTGIVIFLSSANVLGANSEPALVDSIESRNSGIHGVYLSKTIPSQDCTFADRAVVNESDPGGKTQLSVLLAALASGKKVVVGVSGCTDIGVTGAGTAPHVIKAHILRE